MTQDNPFQELPTYVKKSSPKFNPLLFIVILLVFALLGGGGYYYFGMTKNEATKASPVPNTPKPTVMISPTVSASVSGIVTPTEKSKTTPTASPTSAANGMDRSKLKVAVLNGSGTVGAAKGTSSHLETLGYVITTVGNADNFTYEGLTVKVKKSKSDYLSLLKKDLAENDPKVTIATKVDDTIETDAEVIVGK